MAAAAIAQARSARTPLAVGISLAAVATLYLLVGAVGPRMPIELPQPVQRVVQTMRILPPADSIEARRVDATFSRLNYRLDAIREGRKEVPRLLLSRLPADLESLTVDERKRLFLRMMLPLVLSANDAVMEHRRRLEDIAARLNKGAEPTAADADYLAQMAERFQTDPYPAALLRRVDVVPVSLVLAQAATESGWGTSRFAREGNALFGQWTFSGKGMKPLEADEGARHGVRAFADLQSAVRAYMHNLNTHPAYREFRRERERLRAEGRRPEGAILATTLHRYSERGEDYIDTLLTIIRVNSLAALDRARLAPPQIADLKEKTDYPSGTSH